jgi:hypothetical protein
MLSIFGEVPLELLIKHFVAIINIVYIFLIIYIEPLTSELSPLLYLLLQILSHLLHPILLISCLLFSLELLDPLKVSIIQRVLIEDVPPEHLRPLSLLQTDLLGRPRLLERVLGLVLAHTAEHLLGRLLLSVQFLLIPPLLVLRVREPFLLLDHCLVVRPPRLIHTHLQL